MMLGFKGLFIGITDGISQMLLDFALVGEEGKTRTGQVPDALVVGTGVWVMLFLLLFCEVQFPTLLGLRRIL